MLSSVELKKLKETYAAIFDININIIEVIGIDRCVGFFYINRDNYYILDRERIN